MNDISDLRAVYDVMNLGSAELNDVLWRMLVRPFPEHPSLMIGRIIEAYGSGLVQAAREYSNTEDEREPDDAEVLGLRRLEERFDRKFSEPSVMSCDLLGRTVRFVMCEGAGDLHGVHLEGCGNAVLSDVPHAYAECILWSCQTMLPGSYRSNMDLENAVRRYCRLKKRPFSASVPPDDMLGKATLSVHRFDPMCSFLNAVRYSEGLEYIRLNDNERLNTDLRGKKRLTKARQMISPLNLHFRSVEFDDSFTPEMEKETSEELDRLISEGWLPDLGRICTLRFRKYVKIRHGGVFFNDTMNMIVGTKNPGVFVHEYMHVFDHISGSSSEPEFKAIAERYCRLIDRMVYTPEIKTYLRKPTEIHSRCYEMYLHRKQGFGPLLRYGEEHYGMVSDEELDAMTDRYFDRLIERGWRL